MTDRAQRRGTARAGAGLLVLLAACAEPNLHVRVQLPEGLDREGLTVTLSIFAPAGASAVDCEAIAFGDVTLAELRAARIARQVLLAPDTSVGALDNDARVPRAGVKLLLALAARDFGSLEPELAESEAAGCAALDDIDGDRELDLPLRWTATPALESTSLYLVAELGSDGAAGISSQIVDEHGRVRTTPGLRVKLRRADGGPTDSALRLTLQGSDQATQRSVVESLAGTASAELSILTTGLFEITARARYQRGADLPAIQGLAYQVVLDSDVDAGLREALDGCHGLTPGPLGLPGRQAGFLCVRPVAAGQVELVLAGLGLASAMPTVDVQRVPVSGDSMQVLGQIADGAGVAVYAVNVNPGAAQNSRLQLLRSDGARLLDQQLPGPPRVTAVAALAVASPCAPAIGSPTFVVGLRPLLDPLGNLAAWQRYRLDPAELVSEQTLADNLTVARMRTSLCLDDPSGHRVRLFPMRGGLPLPPLTLFALVDELAQGDLRTLRYLDGLLESTRLTDVVLPTDDGPRARLLAWFLHNGVLELNLHALGAAPESCLGDPDAGIQPSRDLCFGDFTYLQTALRLPELPPVAVGDLVTGHLLGIPSSTKPDVAAGLIRGAAYGQFHIELYVLNLGGGPHGRVALDACPDALDCGLAVADLDGDGADELLLALGRDAQGALRAQVLRFRTSP